MRYLGVDYGSKRIGIALSDEEGKFAFPYRVISRDGAAQLIGEIAEKEKVAEIVVGDTRALGGSVNSITEESDAFTNEIMKKTSLPVRRGREAWSSAEAQRFAPKGARHDDSAAAAIILQRFLDSKQKTE